MSACIVGSVVEKDVRKLPDNIHGLNLSRLEECLLESVAMVDQVLNPLLRVQRSGPSKIPYFHADLQIVSLIATAFRVRYNKNDLSEIEGWEAKRDTLAKHLPMYYLYDVLQENWRGAGDNRLSDTLNNESYLSPPPSVRTWEQVFDVWFRNHIADRLDKKLYIKDDRAEYLLLRFALVKTLEPTDSYHVQHLVPISKLKSPLSYYSSRPGPINSIGNIALVTEVDFLDSDDCTFVEYLNRQKGTLGSMRYHVELEKQERLLICKADDLPTNFTQNSFEKFLTKRFQRLIAQFIRSWRDHIPADPQN